MNLANNKLQAHSDPEKTRHMSLCGVKLFQDLQAPVGRSVKKSSHIYWLPACRFSNTDIINDYQCPMCAQCYREPWGNQKLNKSGHGRVSQFQGKMWKITIWYKKNSMLNTLMHSTLTYSFVCSVQGLDWVLRTLTCLFSKHENKWWK
jgi:hypothetical protein